MGINAAPLSGGFMIVSIVGFLISAMYLYQFSKSISFAFMVVFMAMFIASMISMTYSTIDMPYEHKNR